MAPSKGLLFIRDVYGSQKGCAFPRRGVELLARVCYS